MQDFESIPEQALTWIDAGKSVVLATVVQTWGSAPRPIGAQMAISGDMEMVGSVSGGCVENAVVEEAIEALENGQSRMLEYGVSDDNAFATGLACGGEIHVMLTPVGVGLPVEMLRDLVAAKAAHKPMALLTNTKTWECKLSSDAEIAPRFTSDKSGFDGDWFVGIHNPPLRLMVVGAVHIAQPLAKMAEICGFDVTVIDPRTGFANATRFPETKLNHDWPDEALLAQNIDSRVAVVTLCHDPKLDDPAIKVALRSDVFYLGCLGSKRTHAKRLERLRADGFSEAELAKIHGPVGLKIGAKTPAEIALSTMAEITDILRNA